MKQFGLIFAAIGVSTLLLAGAPASAQTQSAAGDMGSSSSSSGGVGSMMGIPTSGDGPDEATRQKRREIEDAYKQATKGQPAQAAASNDPWANMRGAEEAKPAAKTAAKTAPKKKPAQ